MCGLLAWDLYTSRQNLGKDLIDVWHIVLSVAGLYACLSTYVAGNKDQVPLPVWEDMTYVMQMHDIQALDPNHTKSTAEN